MGMSVVDIVGPRERKYRGSKAFRAASDKSKLTPTHWHIAISNGLGWAFDGMDLAILGLVAPLLLKEFGLSLPEFRSAVQIFGIASVVGCLAWPWMADRYGRRTVLSINIAMFSLAMPVAASAPTWMAFVAVYAFVRFTLAGEWAVGAPLVAETWPAKYRGLVLGANRSAFSLGTAFAGLLTAFIAANYGWRAAFYLPGFVAVLAIFVRFFVPESPEWVGSKDRKDRIKKALVDKISLSAEDESWWEKAKRPGFTQLFLPDTRRSTILVTSVYTGVLMSFTTMTQFMPLYLSETHGWTTQEYGLFLTWWGIVGIPAYWISGGMSDKLGRRLSFVICLTWAAFFIAIWSFTTDPVLIWILGLIWSFGYAGVYGPLASFLSELYPTRIRATGTGFTLAFATLIGYVLWPYVLVYLRQWTGSFSACFLLSAGVLILVALIVWFFSPESARRELNSIGE
jgi:MFS transporter, putative metabolite:H+ symporter